MRPAGEAAAQDLAAVAAAAAVAVAMAAAAFVADAMMPLRASVWMVVAVTAAALELPADFAAVVVPGVLALAVVQQTQSGPAGSPSCCQRRGGVLLEHETAGGNQLGQGTQADPFSAWLGWDWAEGGAGSHGDPGPEHVIWQCAVLAPHQHGGLHAARAHCGAGVPWLGHGGLDHPHHEATGPPQEVHRSHGSCAWQGLASGRRRRLRGPHGA